MRALTAAALLAGLFLAAPATADDRDYLPGRHAVMVEGVDFPGADLAPLFDVSFETCEATCLADASCRAFTYNRRSSACFPKSAAGTSTPYQGAISGRIVATDPAALAGAGPRAAMSGGRAAAGAHAASGCGGQLAHFSPNLVQFVQDAGEE